MLCAHVSSSEKELFQHCSHNTWRHRKRVPKQTGIKMSSFQKLKELAILIPIHFNTRLGAAQETPNGYQNKRAPECLVFAIGKLVILKTIRFDIPLGFAETQSEHGCFTSKFPRTQQFTLNSGIPRRISCGNSFLTSNSHSL